MSNPTTKAATFNGAADGFTVSGPERYLAGLWLEEATVNLVANPSASTNTTGWAAHANGAISRETSLPASIPAEAGAVTTCFKFVANSDISGSAESLVAFAVTLGSAVPHIHSWYVYIPTAMSSTQLRIQAASWTSSTSTNTDLDLSKRNQWQRVSAPITPDAGDLAGAISLRSNSGTMLAGEQLWFACVQMEAKPYATSFVGGARAASSASISPSGILSPSSGALAFRITPTIETGVEEIWGECGVKGSGTDHARWGRDASTHPFVEWSSNDAAYQRLTGSETLSAGTAYDLYLGHTGTVTSLAVDAGTLQTGTRAAVSGDFSTGDLTLEASAGGVIYQPFATFNRTLTAKEIATLNGKNNWTMKVLAGNPYRNFQLRPY